MKLYFQINFMPRMMTTIPTQIHINGKPIHGGLIKMKYMKGGICPNQTFQHGTPYNGYVPNVPSTLDQGMGLFDFIPIIGPILGKLTGLGIEAPAGSAVGETQEGF